MPFSYPSTIAARTGEVFAGCAALALAVLASPAVADVKRGVDAWSAGDFAAAVGEWRLPAQSGDADALYNLAQAYRLGRGVEADITRARELYEDAASRGHVKAADNLGLLLFQQGEQARAMPLIRDAAARGDPRARYVLGLSHFNADHAEKDWVRAYALLTLASSAGLPQAAPALAQMDEYVPLSERREAQVLARKLEAEAAQARATQFAGVALDAPPLAQAKPAPVIVPARARSNVAPSPEKASETSPAGRWRVQLGSFGVAGNAERMWAQLSSNPALSGARKAIVPGRKYTTLQAVGFASRRDAQAACSSLKRQGKDCLVVAA
jgi:TPR repeat protein